MVRDAGTVNAVRAAALVNTWSPMVVSLLSLPPRVTLVRLLSS